MRRYFDLHVGFGSKADIGARYRVRPVSAISDINTLPTGPIDDSRQFNSAGHGRAVRDALQAPEKAYQRAVEILKLSGRDIRRQRDIEARLRQARENLVACER